jgi:hypothetical protein
VTREAFNPAFAPWVPGSPNAAGGCASTRIDGWFDASCSDLRPHLCELE